ncbi:hypothetical protein HAX54_009357 [Datura stramonium]|uniref:Uncharacterized protein n=1 Tax=Datura stramonium TaxID=4076 RepID=A0ABS8WY43_DATST|nr:hypothetical protein [Datura stramonium]
MFYENLKPSKDNSDPETLVLGTRIVLTKTLFEKVFNSCFSGNIPFFTGGWPKDFELSRYQWQRSLPYGILMSRIIKAMGVDVSEFPVKEITSTYNDRAFASMGYILNEDRWVKKESSKPKDKISTIESSSNVPPNSSSSSVPSSLLTNLKDVKETLGAVEGDLHKSNESLAFLILNVVDLKNQLTLIQHERVKSFNKVLRQVDSATSRTEISDNELAIAVQNSYSSLST